MIDAHVHLRDQELSAKETIAHGLAVAKKCGITRVFDMPNTKPVLTAREAILDRLSLAGESVRRTKVSYHVHMGLTKDPAQIKEAVQTHAMLFPLVIGLKMFLGNSTGNMGIVSGDDQFAVVKCLTENGYKGVITVHAEKEACMKGELFVKGRAETHSLARPSEAETEAIRDIISIVKETGFEGTLHIAHISAKESVLEVVKARNEGMKIFMGATPHHALLSVEDAKKNPYLKVNPPLRSEEDRAFIFRSLLDGTIDSCESDHAPHTLEDKENGASGLPGFPGMALLLDRLRKAGAPDERLESLFGKSVLKEFGLEDEEVFLPKDTL
ncbi:MAG: dihydroorotase family protein, partial [Bullifex sp.]